ncbi:MAG: glycosyltransferase [Patescibacteria group bacterium]
MNDKKNNPFISVILPVDRQATENIIKGCLSSLKEQTFQNFEVVIITNRPENAFEKLKNVYPFIKVVFSAENKSAARNIGSKLAAADFLLHLDVDMFLEKEVMSEFTGKIKEGSQAIILPERFNASLTYWTKVRDLEKKIYLRDTSIEAPRLIRKEVFVGVGGFDEDLDPLDEWNLYLKIKKEKINIDRINFCAWINRRVTLSTVIKRKYARGRLTRAFKEKYPKMHFINPVVRLKSYGRHLPLFINNPATALGLIFLKMVDFLAFTAGALNPPVSLNKQKELFGQSAEKYENTFYLGSRGGRLIDETEKILVLSWLKKYLISPAPDILDEGCGPGRWSKLLLDNFLNTRVTGLDFSPKMLEMARAKLAGLSRFRSVLSSLEKLDFPEENFDAVLNIRTLKYSPDPSSVLSEIRRVLKPNGLLILEMPYKNPVANLLKIISTVWPAKSGLLGYFKRINLFSRNKIRQMLEENKFRIIEEISLGKLPATLYAKTDSSFLLKSSAIWEKILPQKLCGRSLFFLAQKPEPRPEKENISISVIIPTKNSGRTLETLLESLKKQSGAPLEIIVVDNNSQDETKNIASRYTPEVFDCGPERSSQRNFGAKKARGDWLLFLDSDMILSPAAIEESLKKINSDKTVAALIIPEISQGQGYWANTIALEKSCYLNDPLIEAARLVSKKIFWETKGFDENLIAAEDWDLHQRIKKHGRIERIESAIIHQEGTVKLLDFLGKKYYYAQHFRRYQKKHPATAIKQMNLVFRRAFFKNGRKLLKNPFLSFGLISLKIMESFVGLAAYLKIKLIK